MGFWEVFWLSPSIFKVKKQFRDLKNEGSELKNPLKKIYRLAKETDLLKYESAIDLEDPTLKKAKAIIANHKLEMKLVDVGIKYDEIIDKTESNKKFVNNTNNWKSIYDEKK